MYFPVDPDTQRANCTTGSVRLADPLETSTTIEGRVEVCINQAWGTVCDVRFDAEDAGTVCQIAGGYLRSGTCACGNFVSGTVCGNIKPIDMVTF